MAQKRLRPQVRNMLIGAAAVLVIGAGVLFLHHRSSSVRPGLDYLQQQASLDQAAIQVNLTEIHKQRLLNAVDAGDKPVFALFRDSLLMGDSRMEGFASFGFVPQDQVIAKIGTNIQDIPNRIDAVAAVQPAVLYVSYGVNDMENHIGSDLGQDGFGKKLEGYLQQIAEAAPHTQIVVNSIIPVSQSAIDKQPQLAQTDDFNRQIKEICEKNGWTYVDNSSLITDPNSSVYERDGIHFNSDFYKAWAVNMTNAVWRG